MAEQKKDQPKATESWKGEDKSQEDKDKARAALDQVNKIQAGSIVSSPTEEQSDAAVDALFKEEKKEEGKPTTVVSSISEEEAKKAGGITIPDFLNQRVALDRVPGILNLTADGTLNSDRSKRQDSTVEEMNEIIAKTAGENPIPNREGNELTKIENGFRADVVFGTTQRNKAFAKRLGEMREKGSLDARDKEELKKMSDQLGA